jgi:hypothetical protein
LQDGPSAVLRRTRVLAGDQIAVDDHMWLPVGRFRIDAAVLFKHIFHENGTTWVSPMAASSELAKPVTDLPLTKGEPSGAFVGRKAAGPWHTAATLRPAACIASISLTDSRSSAKSYKGPCPPGWKTAS